MDVNTLAEVLRNMTPHLVELCTTLIVFWLLIYFLGRSLEPRFGKATTMGGMLGSFIALVACLVGLQGMAQSLYPDFFTTDHLLYLSVAIAMVVLYVYTLIFRQGGALQKLFWILVSLSYFFISNIAAEALKLFLFETEAGTPTPVYIDALFLLGAIILMGNFLRPITRKRMRAAKMSPRVMFILTLIPVLASTTLLLLSSMLVVSDQHTQTYALLLFVLALIMAIIVYCSFALFKAQYYQARKELRQQVLLQQAHLSRIHLDEVSALYRETREWRHDYANHLQVLLGYAEQHDYEDLHEYLASLGESVKKINFRFNVGNELLNALLNTKAARAENAGIKLKITGRVDSLDVSFEPTDIASLISNILDNAIEACERINTPSEPLEITFEISQTEKELKLYEKNPSDGKVRMIDNALISSKREPGHGIGSGLINTVVEKYQGYVDRKIQDDCFEIFVLLQRPVSPDPVVVSPGAKRVSCQTK